MAVTPKSMVRATLTTSSATLYTVPGATTAIFTSIVVCNKDTVARTFTLSADGVELFSAAPIDPGTQVFDLRQVLTATKTISGLASVNSMVTVHVSGTETA